MNNKLATQMIEDCNNRESNMLDWERKFIDSISNQIDGGNTLSTKQEDMLEKIWDKVTENG